MLLVIDVGNTTITLGRVRNGALLGARRTATDPRSTPDDLEAALVAMLGLDDTSLADVAAIALSSVVPAVTAGFESLAERLERPLVVASAGTVPIPVRVERPGEVGPDRLVNALAAARLHGAPAIVADFGTATTVDAVGPDGAFLGGAIAPGLGLGLEALATRTARLPRVPVRAPDRVIARDTVGAIQAGAILGYQGLASSLIGRARREMADIAGLPEDAVRTIATGGLSGGDWFAGVSGVEIVDPDLTLRGLVVLHAEVAGGRPLELGLG